MIDKITKEFLDGKVLFHRREEFNLFKDAIQAYSEKKYQVSAILAAVVFEKIFTTRLTNETSMPTGFIPSKDNIREQLDSQLQGEKKITEDDKLFFKKITEALVKETVINQEEKKDYDNFYSMVRNPVVHGLTLRLFKDMLGRAPSSTFEIDANYEVVYSKAAEKLLIKIYELMTVKVLRKQ